MGGARLKQERAALRLRQNDCWTADADFGRSTITVNDGHGSGANDEGEVGRNQGLI